jgi:hypothetical protein
MSRETGLRDTFRIICMEDSTKCLACGQFQGTKPRMILSNIIVMKMSTSMGNLATMLILQLRARSLL